MKQNNQQGQSSQTKNNKPRRLTPSFGMSSITIGRVTVYTAKIRFTAASIRGLRGLVLPEGILAQPSPDNRYATLSFETADYAEAKAMYKKLGTICREIAFNKLHEKYAWVSGN